MSYADSFEKATEFARLALDQMAWLGIAPTPDNFTLWYCYCSGRYPDLTRTVDILMADGQIFNEAVNRELFEQFIGLERESEALRETETRIQKALGYVLSVLDQAGERTGQYGTNLTAFLTFSSEDHSLDQLRWTIAGIVEETRSMSEHNRRLGDRLSFTSRKLARMREDLESVRREAMTDALTDIANRKSFDSELRAAAGRAMEGGQPLSLMMVDIDHFKSFNDSFGHQAGDEVLRLTARLLQEGLNSRHLPARYGGEEFAIILPETELEGALQIAEQIRQNAAAKKIVRRNTGEMLACITLSIGVAQFEPGESIGQFIHRADLALYAAKRDGRNRVVADSGTSEGNVVMR